MSIPFTSPGEKRSAYSHSEALPRSMKLILLKSRSFSDGGPLLAVVQTMSGSGYAGS
jgi:hypothetical protein